MENGNQETGRDSGHETYIIRLHRRSSNNPQWYGQVQHVRSGRAVTVHGLLELLSCFEHYFPGEDGGNLARKGRGLK
ncbi:MAG: hypothetical protein FJZ96_11480 [Chloroflexi bacterium]|nr:hypothetical protein [Chloroflexota bacterium]